MPVLLLGSEGLAIFLDIGSDRIWLEHALAQCAEDTCLQLGVDDASAVVAGARFTGGAAPPAVAADDGERTAAGAACDQPAQQPLWPSLTRRRQRLAVLEPPLCRGPALLVDDPQGRHFVGDPLVARIGSGDPLAADGIAHEALPVVADDAGI
nr:hypothetical protein [Sphingomonas sp. PP-F2F-G114-C0414]